MKKQPTGAIIRHITLLFCALFILQSQAPIFAQSAPIQVVQPAQASPPIAILSPAQLDSLVTPIALYPDPLLSQVLAASTYPLEIVEAGQWLRQNSALTGAALEEAAKQQDWDPSVQALVLFPDVLQRLSENIRWTTDLGNAFLAQQAGVMDAVQKMRSQAVTSGNLTSTPQTVVTTQPQGATTIVAIQPANPQVIYVPVYDPLAIWGPAYSYPVFYYPRTPVIIGSRLISFSSGVFVGSFFTGWNGWDGWGWRPNWFGRTVVVNNNFFYRYGYRTVRYGGNRIVGPAIWQHDPGHRWSAPYSNRLVETQRFRNDVRRPQANRPQAVVRSAAPVFAPRQAPPPNVSRPMNRAFVPAAPGPGVSRSAPDNPSRFNRRAPAQSAAPNAPNQNRGFSGDSVRSSRQPVQTFRDSPRPAPQRSPRNSGGDAPGRHGNGQRSGGQGDRRR